MLDEGQFDELVLHEGGPHQLHMGEKINCSGQLPTSTEAVRFVRLAPTPPDTSMVSVLVSEGTHSRASSEQQPPHRLKDTQDGMKR